MVRAVELVRERLLRATAALDAEGISYAVIGGNAVAGHVAKADPTAVRNTPNVDILLRRTDLEAATKAMAKAEFLHHEVSSIDTFLDGPQGRLRDSVHIIFASEMIQPNDVAPTPDVDESELGTDFRVVTLEALVRMKLTAFRTIDRVHLRDMLEIGLLDASWVNRLSPDLAARLQELIDDPNG
jgi:hypothetical protein